MIRLTGDPRCGGNAVFTSSGDESAEHSRHVEQPLYLHFTSQALLLPGHQKAQPPAATRKAAKTHRRRTPLEGVTARMVPSTTCPAGRVLLMHATIVNVNDIDMDMCTHVAQPARLVGLHVPPPTTPFALWCLDPCSPAVPWADKCH